MARKREDLHKHTLYFRTGDWEKLESAYPGISTSIVVRNIISNFVDKIEGQPPIININLGEINL